VKSFKLFIAYIAVIPILLHFSVNAQSTAITELVADRYYLIVGAFKSEENAQKLFNQYRSQLLGSGLAIHPQTSMTYVFAFSSDSRTEAMTKLDQIKLLEGLSETWLYRHRPSASATITHVSSTSKEPADKKSDTEIPQPHHLAKLDIQKQVTEAALKENKSLSIDTITQLKVSLIPSSQKDQVFAQFQVNNAEAMKSPDTLKAESSPHPAFITKDGSLVMPTSPYKETLELLFQHDYDTPISEAEEELVVYFHVHNAISRGLESMPITIIDGDSERKLFYLEPHQKHVIRIPKSSLGNLQIVGVGKYFKRFTMDLDYYRLNEITSEKGSLITREGSLIKISVPVYRNSDPSLVADYSVFFQNGSAIFRTQSKFELNSMLELLKENEELTVVINGHTNGNSYGDLLKNIHDEFFKVSHQTVKAKGTAMELSEERAKMVKRYLIRNGISPNRIETKSWAGEKPLYKTMSYFGSFNGRAHIEIIQPEKISD
jgi:outer membrane protein OmpA-like peptidoglycan-associated protein